MGRTLLENQHAADFATFGNWWELGRD